MLMANLWLTLRETKADADIANVLTMDEARRIASNIAKLATFLAAHCGDISRSFCTQSKARIVER